MAKGGEVLADANPLVTSHYLKTLIPAKEEYFSDAELDNIKNTRILLVEDNRINQMVAKGILNKLGLYSIDIANNGVECLEKLRQKKATRSFDVVLMDCQMPEMDGYTLTAEIKGNDCLKAMPVILHTSLSGVFNNAMVEKVGAEDFIPKFHPDELATAVKKWLKKDEMGNGAN